jgi:hypothetical protein
MVVIGHGSTGDLPSQGYRRNLKTPQIGSGGEAQKKEIEGA